MKARGNRGFTLIELLVVIAIIAILAAILFPVFAQAREKARQATCLSNMQQMGLATIQYNEDYDEQYYPHRFNLPAGVWNPLCQQAGGSYTCTAANGTGAEITGTAAARAFWPSLLQPYLKNYGVFADPSNPNAWVDFDPHANDICGGGAGPSGCAGRSYGAENSYGHNDAWLSPAGQFNSPSAGTPFVVNMNQVQRPANTILVVDATYYGAAFDILDQSGTMLTYGGQYGVGTPSWTADRAFFANQSKSNTGQYENYWKNIGNSKYGYDITGGTWDTSADTTVGPDATGAAAIAQVPRHQQMIDVQFCDGHVKALPYREVVGDVCLWSIDYHISVNGFSYTGRHPFCN